MTILYSSKYIFLFLMFLFFLIYIRFSLTFKIKMVIAFAVAISNIAVICTLFYFIVPVPSQVEYEMTSNVLTLQQQNNVKTLHVTPFIEKKCGSQNKKTWRAYEIFELHTLYYKDLVKVMNDTGVVNLGSVGQNQSYKKLLCESIGNNFNG